jgi:hypothetical protein
MQSVDSHHISPSFIKCHMKQIHTHPIDYRRGKCKKSPCQLKIFFNEYLLSFDENVKF